MQINDHRHAHALTLALLLTHTVEFWTWPPPNERSADALAQLGDFMRAHVRSGLPDSLSSSECVQSKHMDNYSTNTEANTWRANMYLTVMLRLLCAFFLSLFTPLLFPHARLTTLITLVRVCILFAAHFNQFSCSSNSSAIERVNCYVIIHYSKIVAAIQVVNHNTDSAYRRFSGALDLVGFP